MRYDEWLQLRLGLLACYQGQPANVGKHQVSPDYASVWLIHRGAARLRKGTTHLEVTAGQGVFLGQGPREQTLSEDLDFCSISFFANWPDGSPLFPEGPPLVFDGDQPNLIQSLDGILQIFTRAVPVNSFFSFREKIPLTSFLELQEQLPAFLNQLLPILEREGMTVNENREWDERVLRAIQLMARHNGQGEPFDLAALSKACGISASHLDRLFRLQVGISPMKWQNRLRHQRARQLLQFGELSVKQVSYELGFSSLSHFSRWYKSHAGHSPSGEARN